MVYNLFLESVRKGLLEKLGAGHELRIHSIPKNNGVTLDGISDYSLSVPLAPTVYLNSYYEQVELGKLSVDEVCCEIADILSSSPLPDNLPTGDLGNYGKMQPRVMMKLIHHDSNKNILADVPYVPYLDLAIVFYLLLEHSSRGQMTVLIHKEHMKQWGVDEKNLLALAIPNTSDTYPAQIRTMAEVLKKIAKDNLGEDYNEETLDFLLSQEDAVSPLYVLTNPSGIYGAACILYKDVLKDFADRIESDLIIIPSSIHEVLLVPFSKDTDFDELNDMVEAVNKREVSLEDRLSNHVYQYSRSLNQISIPQFRETSL